MFRYKTIIPFFIVFRNEPLNAEKHRSKRKFCRFRPIRDLLRADQLKTGNIYVYTGFNDRAREHDWVGEGGAPFSNAGLYKWQKSEPNNYWNQDCAMIVTTRSELWDVRCKGQYKAKALCEIEA